MYKLVDREKIKELESIVEDTKKIKIQQEKQYTLVKNWLESVNGSGAAPYYRLPLETLELLEKTLYSISRDYEPAIDELEKVKSAVILKNQVKYRIKP